MPRNVASLALLAFLLLAPLAASKRAGAIEAFDGRLQAHGFLEMQVREISKGYKDQFDLTQWYNIVNLELELDIAPDGFGPFDLVNAFVRAEGRFDCVWSRGCGIAPMATAFGDRSGRTDAALSGSLPTRLSNAISHEANGQIVTGPVEHESVLLFSCTPTLANQGLCDPTATTAEDYFVEVQVNAPVGLDSVSSYGFFAGLPGPDETFDTGDEPFPYVFEAVLDWRFAQIANRGGGQSGLPRYDLGPWLPKNVITPIAALADRVNPFDTSVIFPFTMVPPAQDPGDGTRNIRGGGARPFRPIPAVDAGRAGVPDPTPRGLFYPSRSLQGILSGGELNSLQFNYDQDDLQWNRGASQTTKELKEAYLDIEMFDNRLWLRVGKQVIVWGKTELFRNMDQFNPIDLALSSLPSLEESRIPYVAARGVWSFYDVGPLDDVRLELAFIFDQYLNNDLGRCGEPYTPNPTCVAGFGGLTNGTYAIGLVGFDRPEDPWNDISDTEFGVRVEFRWKRASFAIANFNGYGDFPFVDQVTTYERNVDPLTGRPRVIGTRGPCPRNPFGNTLACLLPGPTNRGVAPDGTVDPSLDNSALANAPRNSLLYHYADQQVFAAICAATVGASSLDRSACTLNLFNSPALAPVVGIILAGTLDANAFLIQAGLANDSRPWVELNRAFFDRTPPFANPLLPTAEPPGFVDCLDPVAGTPCGYLPGSIITPFPASLLPPGIDNTLSNRLSPEQEALWGCGPFYAVNCDNSGVDLLNADASQVVQSFIGVEGTRRGWRTDDATIAQPGTICFLHRAPRPGETCPLPVPPRFGQAPSGEFVQLVRGGPICTTSDFGGRAGLLLPGCRGLEPDGTPAPNYNAVFDGVPGGIGYRGALPAALSRLCLQAQVAGDGPGCPSVFPYLARNALNQPALYRSGHPFTGQPWSSEGAALSWNFLMLLVSSSSDFTDMADATGNDDFAYTPPAPGAAPHCSYLQPQFCGNVTAILFVAGAKRNTVLAGGDLRYGRRTFAWHSGGQAVARFNRRNVLGFGVDFAEDRTKSNWGFEFSWVDDARFTDRDVNGGISESDTVNLTISADRPTFINFLNSNRTFFMNMQWFFGYIPSYRQGFTTTGPFNALGTFTISTAYYQDRLLSSVTLVAHIQSPSGAVLPSLTYRITSNFSFTVGMGVFFGKPTTQPMPTNGLLPGGNHIGPEAYQSQVEQGLDVIRDRDEVFLRMRYSF